MSAPTDVLDEVASELPTAPTNEDVSDVAGLTYTPPPPGSPTEGARLDEPVKQYVSSLPCASSYGAQLAVI